MEGRTNLKRAPLTAAEKKHRRDNGLCLYCGDPGHKVSECPRCLTNRSNVTNASDPETALSQEPVLRPFGATSTTMKKLHAGLLTLSRELRDEIYEYLFDMDEFQVQQDQARTKLDPSILRVCQQLHDEASEFLYEKHGWVTATLTEALAHSLYWNGNQSISGFPNHRQPFTRYDNDRLSNSAILNMDLRRDIDSGASLINVVIPLAAMSHFCRRMSEYHRMNETDLILRFNYRAKESHQSHLLGCLGQARGLRSVDIASPEPTWASLNITLLMTHRYKRLAEILNTMSTYQESSEKELKLGRTLVARNIIQDGVNFVDWWSDNVRGRMQHSQTFSDTDMDRLFEARADMGFSSASLSLRVGDIDFAQQAIQNVLERLSMDNQHSLTNEARAHYGMAQTFEALGWGNAALYSYLQALWLRPGYAEADAAVDLIEENLGSGTALEDARVKHNLDHVLNTFRSQSVHSTRVRDRDYKQIFRNFEGTAAEIRSLNRYSGGETDPIYMNPNYEHELGGGW